MWDQTQRMAGREKVCIAVYEEKCFCVLTFESKGHFALQLCVWKEEFSRKSSVGEEHNGSAQTPLCPADTAQAEVGSLLFSAAALGIYFSLDEGKVWSQTPGQVPVFVPCKSKLFLPNNGKILFS